MSILHSRADDLLHPEHRERRLRRLGSIAADLACGTTDVIELKRRLADGVDVAPSTNLVRESADPISHANVSAARALGLIVPGP